MKKSEDVVEFRKKTKFWMNIFTGVLIVSWGVHGVWMLLDRSGSVRSLDMFFIVIFIEQYIAVLVSLVLYESSIYFKINGDSILSYKQRTIVNQAKEMFTPPFPLLALFVACLRVLALLPVDNPIWQIAPAGMVLLAVFMIPIFPSLVGIFTESRLKKKK